MWKEEFYKLYFNENFKDRDTFKAEEIKNKNFPESLYKYTKSNYAIKTLENNYMKISNYIDLNDPYEGELIYENSILFEYNKRGIIEDFFKDPRFNFTKKEKEKIINSEKPIKELLYTIYRDCPNFYNKFSLDDFYKDSLERLKDFQNFKIEEFNYALKKRIYLISLSEKNNINPMWAHYADNHKGVCIEYNLNDSKNETVEMTDENRLNLFRDSLLNECCFPVYYVKHSDFSKDLEFLYEDSRNKLKLLEEPFLKKSIDWNYENEWRVILDKDRVLNMKEVINLSELFNIENSSIFIKMPKPKSIYLGLKIEENDENKIIKLCSEEEIPIFKMKIDKSKYNLTFEQID